MFPYFVLLFLILLFFIIPYRNEKRCECFPFVTYSIILLNVLLYLVDHWGRIQEYGHLFGVMAYTPRESAWYTLFTYSFAHMNVFHIGFNMWFFYLIGGQVEERMGRGAFALFYLGGAWASALGYWIFTMITAETLPMIGASGAVYATLGAYFILYPFEEFRFFYSILFRMGTISIATLFFVGYKVLGDLLYAWMQMKYAHQGVGLNVAHWSHLAGLIFGVSVSLAAFGAYSFTGKKRPTYDDKQRRRLFKKKSRRKFYSDAALPEPMTEAEFEAATDDCTPAEAIQRGIFFHNGRMIEWGFQEMLFENPKACLEAEKQLEMIEMMRVHGRDSLAEVACWNLLEKYPSAPEAVQVRLELGRRLARLPEMRQKAAQLLREFLNSGPSARDRIDAERILKRIEDKPLWNWRG